MHTTALHVPKTTCHKPSINCTGSSIEPPMNLLNRPVLCLSQLFDLSVEHFFFFHVLNNSLAEKNAVTFVRWKNNKIERLEGFSNHTRRSFDSNIFNNGHWLKFTAIRQKCKGFSFRQMAVIPQDWEELNLIHPSGWTLSSDWCANSLILVVYENFFSVSVTIFCLRHDWKKGVTGNH